MGGQRPVRHPRALERPLPDGSLTLFHPGTLEFITLSPLAAFLWASSTGQDTVDALVGEVRALFPAQEEVERDVHKLVQVLACRDSSRSWTRPSARRRMRRREQQSRWMVPADRQNRRGPVAEDRRNPSQRSLSDGGVHLGLLRWSPHHVGDRC